MKQKINHNNNRRRRRSPKYAIISDNTGYYSALDSEIYGITIPENTDNIDPWDLENYDYVRKKLSMSSESPSPSQTIEPLYSSYVHQHSIPNNIEEECFEEDCHDCYYTDGLDSLYNIKYHNDNNFIYDAGNQNFIIYSDYESPYSTERHISSSEEENNMSGNYGYTTTGVSNYASSLYSTYSKFALSKKGLLQIDYSCNWNDLDRYIGKKY